MSLKSYIEKLESLPMDLQRNLQLMRELDVSAQTLMKGIQQDSNNLIENIDNMDDTQRYEQLKSMTEAFSLALKQGEDKVSLAAQTYNLTDIAIRKLDEELTRFELEELINIKPIKADSKTLDKRSGKAKKEENNPIKKKKKNQNDKKEEPNKNKNKEKNDKDIDELAGVNIDPNEPTYCYCNQVSYGDMVGCDDETCIREWFHYQCVGLKTQPKGKWYCNDCLNKRKSGGTRR